MFFLLSVPIKPLLSICICDVGLGQMAAEQECHTWCTILCHLLPHNIALIGVIKQLHGTHWRGCRLFTISAHIQSLKIRVTTQFKLFPSRGLLMILKVIPSMLLLNFICNFGVRINHLIKFLKNYESYQKRISNISQCHEFSTIFFCQDLFKHIRICVSYDVGYFYEIFFYVTLS